MLGFLGCLKSAISWYRLSDKSNVSKNTPGSLRDKNLLISRVRPVRISQLVYVSLLRCSDV